MRILTSEQAKEHLYARIVISDSGCHEWTGGGVRRGYGVITINKRILRTHRLAWELANGPIPDGLYVCHSCDNPKCCNVDHLWLGTPQQNIDDMIAKGRHKESKKSSCIRGHEFNEANTRITPKGHRSCRACMKIHARAYFLANRDIINEQRRLRPDTRKHCAKEMVDL